MLSAMLHLVLPSHDHQSLKLKLLRGTYDCSFNMLQLTWRAAAPSCLYISEEQENGFPVVFVGTCRQLRGSRTAKHNWRRDIVVPETA